MPSGSIAVNASGFVTSTVIGAEAIIKATHWKVDPSLEGEIEVLVAAETGELEVESIEGFIGGNVQLRAKAGAADVTNQVTWEIVTGGEDWELDTDSGFLVIADDAKDLDHVSVRASWVFEGEEFESNNASVTIIDIPVCEEAYATTLDARCLSIVEAEGHEFVSTPSIKLLESLNYKKGDGEGKQYKGTQNQESFGRFDLASGNTTQADRWCSNLTAIKFNNSSWVLATKENLDGLFNTAGDLSLNGWPTTNDYWTSSQENDSNWKVNLKTGASTDFTHRVNTEYISCITTH